MTLPSVTTNSPSVNGFGKYDGQYDDILVSPKEMNQRLFLPGHSQDISNQEVIINNREVDEGCLSLKFVMRFLLVLALLTISVIALFCCGVPIPVVATPGL